MLFNKTIKNITFGLLLALGCHFSSFSMEKAPTAPEPGEPLVIREHRPDVTINPWNPRLDLLRPINEESDDVRPIHKKPFEGRIRNIYVLVNDIVRHSRADERFHTYIHTPKNLLVLLQSYPQVEAVNLVKRLSQKMPSIMSEEIQKWRNKITLKNGQMLFEAVCAGDINLKINPRCKTPDLKVIETILKKPNTDVDWQEPWTGTTALMIASREGRTKIVELLLAAGANVNATNLFGGTALKGAIEHEHIDIIKLLLAASEGLEAQELSSARYAAELSSNPHIKKLFSDHQLKHQQKLYEAVNTKNPSIAKIASILATLNSWELHWRNDHGLTALMQAAAHGHTEVVRLILEAGATADSEDKDGRTALIFACGKEGNLETVKLLLAARAKINKKPRDEFIDWTALTSASYNSHIEIVQFLLENGADHSIKDSQGKTALDYAVENNHAVIAEMLKEKGCQIM